MSWIIRENAGFPPGGLLYEDPRTPAAKWVDQSTWVDGRVVEVISFRKANPTIYPEPEWTDPVFVAKQIILFNCQRWGFNPMYCVDVSNTPAALPAPIPARTCPADGEVLEPKYCATCGGRKITGYHCPKCGKDYPR